MSTVNPTRDSLSTWLGSKKSGLRIPAFLETERFTYIAVAAMIVPALALLALGVIAGLPANAGEIESGVQVGNYEVADIGEQATADQLQASLDSYLQSPLTLKIGDREVDVSPRDLGIGFDMDATFNKAAKIGHGNTFAAAHQRFTAHTSGVDIAPVVTYDREQFVNTLFSLSEGIVTAPRNATYYFDGSGVAVEPSSEGLGIDTMTSILRLEESVRSFDGDAIEIATVTIPPDVSTADLQADVDAANALTSTPIRISDQDMTWQLTAADLASIIDYKADGTLSLDTAGLEARLGTLGPTIRQPAQNADIVRNDDGTFTITPETIDRTLNTKASAAALQQAVAQGERSASLVVDEQNPPYTSDGLFPLYRDLTSMVTVGMTVKWFEGEAQLDKAAFANSLIYDIQNDQIGFDRDKLAQALQPAADQASHPPTNLRWKGQLITTDASQPGVSVDVNATVDNVIQAAKNGESTAELAASQGESIDVAAAGIQINQVLGSSSTYYGDSAPNRKTNVEVAAQALDGAMVAPHSEFSFNNAIGGTATLDDGYMMGYGIMTNSSGTPITVPSVAGGICQVATTMFQASFWAGMPITHRTWHMYWIPRYGNGSGGLKGLDATVDPDYDLDYNFANPTDDWLAVRANADGENITIEVWGVNQGWNVQVEDPVITNVVTADTTNYRQADPSMAPGQEVRVEHAEDGFTAAIHRVVTDADGKVIDDTTFKSTYVPAQNITLVAPGEA